METLKSGSDALFILLGAIMVLAMHAGFAFLELGTVRKKNQVNALVKILVDFAVSTIAYFFIGYGIAYGVNFFSGAEVLAEKNGYELVKFFFLLTFAAAIPAIVSGGIAERAKFNPQLIATFVLVGFVSCSRRLDRPAGCSFTWRTSRPLQQGWQYFCAPAFKYSFSSPGRMDLSSRVVWF